MSGILAGLGTLIGLLLSACSILPTPQAVTPIMPTRSPTSTAAATIQWFPPTHTPTPFPTPLPRQPTAEQRLGMGEVVLRDTFESRSGWLVGQYNGGTAAYSRQRLDVVTQPALGASVVVLRSGTIPTDFYFEMSVSPSLCRGKDSYGLIFRAEGELSHYRLFITCEGQVRVERSRNSYFTREVPMGPTIAATPYCLRRSGMRWPSVQWSIVMSKPISRDSRSADSDRGTAQRIGTIQYLYR